MKQKRRIQLFDEWAQNYDSSIQPDGRFPFDGYEQVLNEIVRTAHVQSGNTVLDLGIGTGNLSAHFVGLGCDVWGIDFSVEMIAKALEKLPQAVLVQADLLNEWPAKLNRRFDRIISGYVLHEFDISTKMKLLKKLTQRYLAEGGFIVIGDISFHTIQTREQAHRHWANLWDEEEHYWAADETVDACKSIGLKVKYKQISSCGGVLVFEPISEN